MLALCYVSVSIQTVLFYYCEELIYIQILYMLNSLDITSERHIIAIFSTADLQTIFHTQYAGMYKIYEPNFTCIAPKGH
jgi:hypothetical protein